jgi:hypothetical protein
MQQNLCGQMGLDHHRTKNFKQNCFLWNSHQAATPFHRDLLPFGHLLVITRKGSVVMVSVILCGSNVMTEILLMVTAARVNAQLSSGGTAVPMIINAHAHVVDGYHLGEVIYLFQRPPLVMLKIFTATGPLALDMMGSP